MVPKYDLDIHYHAEPPADDDPVLLFPEGKTLIREETDGTFLLPTARELKNAYPDLSDADFTYLFRLEAVRVFGLYACRNAPVPLLFSARTRFCCHARKSTVLLV